MASSSRQRVSKLIDNKVTPAQFCLVVRIILLCEAAQSPLICCAPDEKAWRAHDRGNDVRVHVTNVAINSVAVFDVRFTIGLNLGCSAAVWLRGMLNEQLEGRTAWRLRNGAVIGDKVMLFQIVKGIIKDDMTI